MSLEKRDALGTVKINDAVFAKIVLKGIERTEGKAFCASEKGKMLGGISQRVSVGELTPNLKIYEKDGACILEFYIIMTFGASIGQVSQGILDYIVGEIRTMFPRDKGKVKLKIVGIKSKQIAERNILIEREYEPAR